MGIVGCERLIRNRYQKESCYLWGWKIYLVKFLALTCAVFAFVIITSFWRCCSSLFCPHCDFFVSYNCHRCSKSNFYPCCFETCLGFLYHNINRNQYNNTLAWNTWSVRIRCGEIRGSGVAYWQSVLAGMPSFIQFGPSNLFTSPHWISCAAASACFCDFFCFLITWEKIFLSPQRAARFARQFHLLGPFRYKICVWMLREIKIAFFLLIF